MSILSSWIESLFLPTPSVVLKLNSELNKTRQDKTQTNHENLVPQQSAETGYCAHEQAIFRCLFQTHQVTPSIEVGPR